MCVKQMLINRETNLKRQDEHELNSIPLINFCFCQVLLIASRKKFAYIFPTVSNAISVHYMCTSITLTGSVNRLGPVVLSSYYFQSNMC